MPTPSETISSLHTKVVDAAKGYEEAREIGRRANVGDLCDELRKTHMSHAHELAGLLLERGERPDSDGSFMSVVHKVVLNVRFALTADEKSLLPGLRDGEKRILEAYDDALRECEIAGRDVKKAEVEVLKKQRESVVANIGKIDAMQEASGQSSGQAPA
ncbi:DUF2383 domain-containing protein [Pararhodobacter sp. SW119]|uniref:DUF2383 domain-containing protein n=1 Tax=Pararhodobacter sp. SW119 TaxID=2780075 RepID=UPI001ADFCD54|nr:DUF2383 domain-containing protein [Pararhodobacter sp. SW119]